MIDWLIDERNEIASLFINNSSSLRLCVRTCVYVGEWSRREWCRITYIHWRQLPLVLVGWQQRWHTGRWPWQSSHSTAQQSTTSRTCPHQHRLTSPAVEARTIISQWTHLRTLRSAQRQWWWPTSYKRHLKVHSTMMWQTLICCVILVFVVVFF